jgi:DNA-binding XRE family transcriptional regulator
MRKIRDVQRLKYACGLSEQRIALAIGLSRSTINAYLKRADTYAIAWPIAHSTEVFRANSRPMRCAKKRHLFDRFVSARKQRRRP